ncbi:hypothetical protein KCV05_g247, partial [Aureobasidium melanogenum]
MDMKMVESNGPSSESSSHVSDLSFSPSTSRATLPGIEQERLLCLAQDKISLFDNLGYPPTFDTPSTRTTAI